MRRSCRLSSAAAAITTKSVAVPAAACGTHKLSAEPSKSKPRKREKQAGTEAADGTPAKREYEAKWWAQGLVRVAGVDEAGRGPLAGPVVAAACCMPASVQIAGIGDSKTIGEEDREALYKLITTHPEIEWAACVIDHETIDEINILQATMRAMEGAVAGLPNGCDRVLVDGPKVPAGLIDRGEPLVKGDSRSYIIGAASIIAKVTRDRIMKQHDAEYPQYGFGKHKGYGTADHMALVRLHGPCPIHRRSFEPVKSMVANGGRDGAAGETAAAKTKNGADEGLGGADVLNEIGGGGRKKRVSVASAAKRIKISAVTALPEAGEKGVLDVKTAKTNMKKRGA